MIKTSAPLGSIFNPRFPAASGGRGMIGHMMVPAIMMALAQALPERAFAEGSSNSSITVAGEYEGRPYSSICFMNAGQGATRYARAKRLSSVESGNTDRVFEHSSAAGDRAQHPARQRRRHYVAAAGGSISRLKSPAIRCWRR